MKRAPTLTLAIAALALAGTSARQAANAQSSIPSYYDQLQYNLTSPTTYATAVGGYANPGVYAVMPGGEFQFGWTDQKIPPTPVDEWATFLGGPNIGFGVVRDAVPLANGTQGAVLDYRLALSGGTKSATFGVGYGWSRGDNELAGRSSIFQFGLVNRFGRYVSLGIVGNFATKDSDRTGVFDVAVRPLGDERLALWADTELAKGLRVSDSPWSVGAIVEPVAGLQLIGRYYENESYSFAIAFGIGGGKIAGGPRYDKDNDHANTIYEVRGGFPDPSFVDDYAYRDSRYLSINMKGSLKYRRYQYFDTDSRTLLTLITDLEKAKDDDRISGVAMNLSGAVISRGKAWEVREKLRELQAAGKHVVVFVDELGMTQYHLASVADRVVMDPEGIAVLPGYVMGRTFVRDMLDKIGVGFDEWRFLEYKSAAEPLSRTSMSEADREQRLKLLEDRYETVRAEVRASREIDERTFDDWINDKILFDAHETLAAGMVDRLGRWDDVKKVIEELEGEKKAYVSRGGIAANEFPSRLWGEDPKVAVVYGLGVCAMDTGIQARRLEKIFQKLAGDRSVKAVVFRVDSPGGSALASDVAAAAMRKCAEKKPVIISQGDVAASGGYWLSMYGTKVYSLPTTITGSIGVIGGWLWNEGMGEKLGHTSDHVQVGDHADFAFGIRILLAGPVLPDRNLTPDEREKLMDTMERFYNMFIGKVATGRGMDSTAVHLLGQGRVYSGVHAKQLGLVDEIGGLDAAIAAARTAAGIDADERVAIVEYPKMGLFRWPDSGPFSPIGTLLGRASEPDELDFLDNPEWSYLQALINSPGRPLVLLPPEYYPQDGGPFGN